MIILPIDLIYKNHYCMFSPVLLLCIMHVT